MKHFKSKTFSTYIGILIAFAILASSFFGFVLKPKADTNFVNAASEPSTSLKDPNFNNQTGTSYPITPNTTNYTPSSTGKTSGTYGIVNLDANDYKNTYPQNPNNKSESRVLMLSSGEKKTISVGGVSTTETVYNNRVKFGYITTSGQIDIEQDSNYVLSVDVLTRDVDGYGGIGSLYLYDRYQDSDDNNIIAKFDRISTVKNPDSELSDINRSCWETYHFMISTNDITSYSLYLGMFIDGKGDVLYDNLSLTKVSDQELSRLKTNLDNNTKTGNYTTIDKDTKNLIATYSIDGEDASINNHFKLNFNPTSGTYVKAVTSSVNDESVTGSKYFEVDNTNAVFTFDKDIMLSKNRTYKITSYVRAEQATSVSLNLKQTGLSDDSNVKSASINVNTSSNLEDVKNGFVPYSFYVQTGEQNSTNFNLSLAVGSFTDGSTTGSAKVYISRVVVELCNYANYSSTNANSTTLSMVYSPSNLSITNGNFSNIQIEDYSKPYPAKPANWTVTDNSNGNGSLLYGVINNSQKTELKAQGNIPDNVLGAIPLSPSNTNMLMLYTNLNQPLSYTSSSFKCTANNYYKFSARALAKYGDATLSIVTTLNNEEVVLASRTIKANEDLFSNLNNAATLYLHTGNQELDVSLKITVKANNSVSLAFIDDASAETTTEQIFNNQPAEVKKDLDFSINSTNFTLGSRDNANIDISTLAAIDMTVPNLSANEKVLIIDAHANESNITVKSNYGFELSSSKYYKLSVNLFTKDLVAYNSNNERDDSLEGVTFGLTNFEQFNLVKSGSTFREYTFYLKPSTDTTSYLSFMLGSEGHPIKGLVYITAIEFDEIEEAEFSLAPTNSNTLVLTTVTTPSEEEPPAEEENPEENSNGFNWNTLPYILSSVIFALTIVVAVVGVVSKKFKGKIKLPTKKSKIDYDRQKTVSKQVSNREASIIRENRLNELNLELKQLIQERSQYEQEYKADLNKVRELKIKRASSNEINAVNKDLKKNQKKTAALGVNISRLENEIEYTKSNMYLSSLIRKLEREGNRETVLEETEQKPSNVQTEQNDLASENAKTAGTKTRTKKAEQPIEQPVTTNKKVPLKEKPAKVEKVKNETGKRPNKNAKTTNKGDKNK